ncbi:MAG: FecR family protein [Sphingobacterium sp.]
MKKKIDGSISLAERNMLDEWFAQNPTYYQILEKIQDDGVLWEDLIRKIEMDQSDTIPWATELREKTLLKIKKNSKATLKLSRYLKIAGSLMLISTFATLFFVLGPEDMNSNIQVVDEISAPSSKAILTFDDGRLIELSSSKSGISVGKDLRYSDGTPIQQKEKMDQVNRATLAVPKGSSYQIMLSDGTKVWLNSGSALKYPLQFQDSVRIVELVGEGYFEVTAKSHSVGEGFKKRTPFSIKTKSQTVEVIGTAFNVQAYDEEISTKTTLVHGQVKVYQQDKKSQGLLLRPGEQSVSNKDEITKKRVDLDEVLGWKDDMFVFNNTDLSEALKVLSRWYDFDIQYEGAIPQTQLFAEIKRSNKLSTVLKLLEKGGVKFRMERQNDRYRLIVRK